MPGARGGPGPGLTIALNREADRQPDSAADWYDARGCWSLRGVALLALRVGPEGCFAESSCESTVGSQ